MCSEPLQGHRTTYTECCCLYGIAWSGQCAFCPKRNSGEKLDGYKTLPNNFNFLLTNKLTLITKTKLCVLLFSEDYAIMCNLPWRGGSDSLREHPGYEYSPEVPEDHVPPYFDNYGNPAGSYDIPESVPLFNDNDYSVQQPPVHVHIPRPHERQPQPVDSYAGRYMHQAGF